MKDKIEQYTNNIKDYNHGIERAFILLEALEDYEKNNINKTFFEKYFTMLNEDGTPKKDYKGNIYTSFRFSDSQYSFEQGKKIFLNVHNSIERIEDTSRLAVIEKTKEYIDLLKTWRDSAIVKRDKYKNFDINAFKADYKKLLEKYNAIDINYDVVECIKFID